MIRDGRLEEIGAKISQFSGSYDLHQNLYYTICNNYLWMPVMPVPGKVLRESMNSFGLEEAAEHEAKAN